MYVFCKMYFSSFSILCQSNSLWNLESVRLGLPVQAAELSFKLKQCTITISDPCIIIWAQRHGSEQDGHDEQVIAVKHICKCERIALRAMVCLWISTVIVSSQLGYLHNQLSGLAILRFPFFPHYNWLFALYSILFIYNHCICACICVILCWMTGSWLGADRTHDSFSQFTAVEGHRSLFCCFHCAFIKETRWRFWIWLYRTINTDFIL